MDEDRRRRYEEVYGRDVAEAEREVEREVFGTDMGIWSYTTPAQADALASELELGPRRLLLDIGSGRGWPSVHLARVSGCDVVATDVPAGSPRSARARAERAGVSDRYVSLRASGTHLPFAGRTFDAVTHTDVL